MALPQRRCYSIERLLRGVQISSSLFLSLSLALSFQYVSPSLSLHLSLARTFFTPCLSPSHPTSVSSWSSSSSSSTTSSPNLSLPSLCLSFRVPLSSSLPLTSLAYPFLSPSLSPSFVFLSFSRNPTTSSLHDLVVGWRPSLVLPTSYSSSVPMLLFGSHLTR